MEIGLSSACFYHEINTEDTVKVIKELGFDSGEIFLNSFCEYEEDFIWRLQEETVKHDFRVISLHAFCSPFEPFLFDKYERRRSDCRKIFTKICRAGEILGAKFYTFHGMKLGLLKDSDMRFTAGIYDELSQIAGEHGIKLCQENVSWCMSSNPDYLSNLMERCRLPVSFTLDIKQAYKAGLEPVKYIEVMGDRIANVHINDRDEGSVCLLPGRGTVNYAGLFQELKEYGYRGDIIIEVYRENYKSYEELTKCRDLLKKYSGIFNDFSV